MNPFQLFRDLEIPAFLKGTLDAMKFIEPTPVQAAAIPLALSGRDILATAQTGTGKTGAFGVPLLNFLFNNRKNDALILAPTRELAAQIHSVLKQMTRGQKIYGCLVVGGESFSRQADELSRGVDYIVATPGRLNDHLQQRTVDLSRIGFLVLDEVDRMLDMGFIPQIRDVMKHIPKERQTLLFSATLPNEVMSIAKTLTEKAERIAIGAVEMPVAKITEQSVRTTNDGKTSLILTELKNRNGKVIIFTRTKSRTDRLARVLEKEGHGVVALHGGRSQGQRKRALNLFRTGSHRIMVATDLAGRGIDVADIEHVINYDLPATREDYIHRIGRTGRFGREGNALSLLVSSDTNSEEILVGKKPKGGSSVPSRGGFGRKPGRFQKKRFPRRAAHR